MPFGKYKGRPLSDIPEASYLLWLLSLRDLEAGFRFAVQRELDRREADQSTPRLPDLRPVADEWRRRLAREFHPDFGGSHDAMKAVNRGYDVLIAMGEVMS
jgi:hypothetical protein